MISIVDEVSFCRAWVYDFKKSIETGRNAVFMRALEMDDGLAVNSKEERLQYCNNFVTLREDITGTSGALSPVTDSLSSKKVLIKFVKKPLTGPSQHVIPLGGSLKTVGDLKRKFEELSALKNGDYKLLAKGKVLSSENASLSEVLTFASDQDSVTLNCMMLANATYAVSPSASSTQVETKTSENEDFLVKLQSFLHQELGSTKGEKVFLTFKRDYEAMLTE